MTETTASSSSRKFYLELNDALGEIHKSLTAPRPTGVQVGFKQCIDLADLMRFVPLDRPFEINLDFQSITCYPVNRLDHWSFIYE